MAKKKSTTRRKKKRTTLGTRTTALTKARRAKQGKRTVDLKVLAAPKSPAPSADPFVPDEQITQSSMGTFKTCEQKYFLRYRLGLVAEAEAHALQMGHMFHEGMRFLVHPSQADEEQRLQQSLQCVNEHVDAALSGEGLVNVEKVNTTHVQLHAMLRSWVTMRWDDFFDNWRVYDTERIYRGKPPNACKHWTDRLAGKLDGLARPQDGATPVAGSALMHLDDTWILEHKTYIGFGYLDFVNGLPLDHQAMFYCTLHGREHDAPKGFVYNALKKPQHTTGATFDGRVQYMCRKIAEAPEKYLLLVPVPFETETVERAGRDIRRTIDAMDNLSPGKVQWDTQRCSDYTGCPYGLLCRRGADVNVPDSVLAMPECINYRNIGRTFPELVEETHSGTS